MRQIPGRGGTCRACCELGLGSGGRDFRLRRVNTLVHSIKTMWQPLVPDELEETYGEATQGVQVQDGEHLIQTRSGEGAPDLESSLEVEWTRVGVQVDVKDKGENVGLRA